MGRRLGLTNALLGCGFLVGWKRIASFLGVGQRTLMRNWERWGLPLFFLSGERYKTPCTHLAFLVSWERSLLEEALKRYSRELSTLERVNHKAILKILTSYLEFIKGQTSKDALLTERRDEPTRPLRPKKSHKRGKSLPLGQDLPAKGEPSLTLKEGLPSSLH